MGILFLIQIGKISSFSSEFWENVESLFYSKSVHEYFKSNVDWTPSMSRKKCNIILFSESSVRILVEVLSCKLKIIQ